MATPVGDVIDLTGDARIDTLVQGSVWQLDTDRLLTYSLDLNFDGPAQNWDSEWSSAVVAGLAAWEAVANIHFQQIGATNAILQNESTADLAIALLPDPETPLAGLGVFPDPVVADSLLESLGYSRFDGAFPVPRIEGDIVYNPAYLPGPFGPGSTSFEVILHEIGHALGLKHMDDDGGNSRPLSEGFSGDEEHRSVMWSTTWLLDGTAYGTPTPRDILAIQHLYGANMGYRTGDDTYALGQPYYWTIWDAGGNDTLEPGTVTGDLVLDLRGGGSSGTLVAGFKLAIAYGAVIENAVGGGGNDTIAGNYVGNRLDGALGDDSVTGGDGADTLIGGDGGDVLLGGAHADRLVGGKGGDSMTGGAGKDTVSGGLGNDRYVVGDALDVITENAGAGSDTVESAVPFTLADNFENLTLIGSAAIDGTGNAVANVMAGNGNANRLFGLAGRDTLDGKLGNDTLEGGAGDDHLNGGFNYAYTPDGDDVLDGGPGADWMEGGSGNDLYIVDNAGDHVEAYSGDDTIRSSVSYQLPMGGEVAHLFLTGRAAIDGTGSFFADHIVGNDAANSLTGASGGNDTLSGMGGNDVLLGGPDNDVLTGGPGADLLDGGAGFDSMAGGPGNDVYVVGANLPAFSIHIEGDADDYISQGLDFDYTHADGHLRAFVALDQNYDGLVDYLTFGYTSDTDSWNFMLRDNAAGKNLLPGDYLDVRSYGNDGHPGLDVGGVGRGGTVVEGEFHITQIAFDYSGAGPVLLSLDFSFDVHADQGDATARTRGEVHYDSAGAPEIVEELPGEGYDTVRCDSSFVLPGNLEVLILTGSAAADGTGNELDNLVQGNDAANVLDGGAGKDRLTGGGAADTFAFSSALGPDNVDRIVDFSVADDTIVLDAAVFTSLEAGALAAGSFVASASPTAGDADDFILYNTTTGALFYDADANGPGLRVQFAVLVAAPALTHEHFGVT